MNYEVLSIDTVNKLARIDKTIEYIEDKIKKSFEYESGITKNYKDRLFTETIIELQIIKRKLKGVENDDRT